MINNGRNILTLKEALQQPCKYRDLDLALQPMNNHTKTYMENDFKTGRPGAVKGTDHPDGRKEG